eukprot:COSAG02_NODE_5211_length_4538_cov_2.567695_6_plen_61_part_00
MAVASLLVATGRRASRGHRARATPRARVDRYSTGKGLPILIVLRNLGREGRREEEELGFK